MFIKIFIFNIRKYLKYMTIFIYLNKTHAIETIEYLILSISFKNIRNKREMRRNDSSNYKIT